MAYRFSVRGVSVECDTVAEFMAVAQPAHATPTSRTGRARKHTQQSHVNTARGASESWSRAKAYAIKNGMSIGQARSYLSRHPKAKKHADTINANQQ